MTNLPDVGRHPAARGRTVTAVLGPTNTGKTHLAIERMLGHESGVIGLPLRLLAREVYGRVVERVGAEAVALVTGEEKIKPANPRYWISTVEAMPRDLDVAFVAIDEVQLAADLDRGHVFTDRILRRRGREETLLLGAGTMRPILTRLMPNLNVVTRPRLSHLAYTGQRKITRLPRRSAVVAFSAEEVYAIAELIRRQRGGAAVVLGALSPRTRNAQVGLYQSGEVDFLVATDAIGMGLNLDVDHVAFAARRKFDGFHYRDLTPAEMGQIAGRAGRHLRDGTFGVTGRVDPLADDLVSRLESHDFEPVHLLQWRNADLDFSSLTALRASLAAAPREDGLTRAPAGDDIHALEAAACDPEIADIARGHHAVERLWDVCQVPDYRKIAPANHVELVATLYTQLMRHGRLSEDWFARQVAECDRSDGDIDTLSNRIAHIRTWTFVANRPDWLADPAGWQERTHAVEDRLSDALHERLTHRFVDRRTSVLARSLRENATMEADIDTGGEVTVEGHHVGRLDGLRFTPDPEADGNHLKAISAAARRSLAGELQARAERLARDADEVISLTLDGTFMWRGAPVGRLEKGDVLLAPRIALLADEQLAGAPRDNAADRLGRWMADRIAQRLGPLKALLEDDSLAGMARGIAFQLGEALGILERSRISDEVRALSQDDRAALRRHGVRFGAHHIYLPALLKPGPRVLAAQLWALHHGGLHQPGLDHVAALVQSGRMSMAIEPGTARGLYRAFGFRPCGGRAIRIDILERIADQIRAALAWKPGSASRPPGAVDGRVFTVTEQMTSLAGCAGEDFAEILKALGYRSETRPAPAVPTALARVTSAERPAAGSSATTAEAAVEARGGDEGGNDADDTDPGSPEAYAPAPGEPSEDAAVEAPAQAADADQPMPHAMSGADRSEPVPVRPAVGEPDAAAADAPRGAPTDTAVDIPTEVTAGPAVATEIIVWRPGRRPDAAQRPSGRRDGRRDGRPTGPRTGIAAEDGTDGGRLRRLRGPDRHQADQRGSKGRPGKGRPPRKGGERNDDRRVAAPPPARSGGRRESREPDPLSPFAALKGLRDALAERDRRDA